MPDFVRLQSLLAVQRYAERTKPWRGRPAEWPLTSNRRGDTYNLIRGDACWRLKMYRTDVVTYFDDGRIRLNPYDSVTTVQFADYVSPKGVTHMTHRGLMYFRVPTSDNDYVYVNHTTVIKPATGMSYESVYEVLTAPLPDNGVEYALDKAGVKALRATPWFKDLELTWKAINALADPAPRRSWLLKATKERVQPDTARPVLVEALQHFHEQGWGWKDVYTAAYRNAGLVVTVPVPPSRLPERSAWDPE